MKNFTEHKECSKGKSVKIEKPAEIAAQVEDRDCFISLDVKAGYHHYFFH